MFDFQKKRVMKNNPRVWIWDYVSGIAKSIILLPGEECIDLKIGLYHAKKINEDTELVLIERDLKIANKIRKTCQEMGFKNYKVISEDFSPEMVEKHIPKKEYDFIYLDFCGQLTHKVFYGLRKIKNYSHTFAMTFCAKKRNNLLYTQYPNYRKNFVPPVNSYGLIRCEESLEFANWSCDTGISALDLDYKTLGDYFVYRDSNQGSIMVFFTVYQPNVIVSSQSVGNIPVKTGRIADLKAKLAKLESDYEKTHIPAKKAWITRTRDEIYALEA